MNRPTLTLGLVFATSLSVHLAFGGLVAWWASECCGPDIERADKAVEILGVPLWLGAAGLMGWLWRRHRRWTLLVLPFAWFGLVVVLFALGVYDVAYRP